MTDIHANLSSGVEMTAGMRHLLPEMEHIQHEADKKGGPFDISADVAREVLGQPNTNGMSSLLVCRPWANGQDLTQRRRPSGSSTFVRARRSVTRRDSTPRSNTLLMSLRRCMPASDQRGGSTSALARRCDQHRAARPLIRENPDANKASAIRLAGRIRLFRITNSWYSLVQTTIFSACFTVPLMSYGLDGWERSFEKSSRWRRKWTPPTASPTSPGIRPPPDPPIRHHGRRREGLAPQEADADKISNERLDLAELAHETLDLAVRCRVRRRRSCRRLVGRLGVGLG